MKEKFAVYSVLTLIFGIVTIIIGILSVLSILEIELLMISLGITEICGSMKYLYKTTNERKFAYLSVGIGVILIIIGVVKYFIY